MIRRDRFNLGGVLATLAAWGCFEGMEPLPLFSPASDALFYGGYALIAVALVLFYKGFREPK
jgi:hypothetical protein